MASLLLDVLPKFALAKLAQIAGEHGFLPDAYQIDCTPGSNDGDGYIARIVRVTIRGQRCKDGVAKADQELSLICKFPFDDHQQREKFNSMLLFEREVYVYREVLPELTKIQLDHGLKQGDDVGFWSFPHCYWGMFDKEQQESILILEDLKARGLEMKDKNVPSDYEHVETLMIALGKLNACSFALKEQRPDIFEKVKKLDDLLCTVMTTEQTKTLARRNCELAASIYTGDNETDKYWRDKFLSLKDSLWDKTRTRIAGQRAEPYAALNHGDCWINNVMYGYDQTTGKVKEIVMLDWQMARYSSPALDFTNFIYLCGQISLRREKFNDLIKTFYGAFSTTLEKLGGQPSRSLPLETVLLHVQKFGAQVLALGTFAMPIMTKLPEEFFENDNRYKQEFKPQLTVYTNMMKDFISDCGKFDEL
ncbi:uncharacterized protein LOC128744707 [Sabethes cyaneus]|uniref:uncharacterized protein LOC128744707 n=1 Tax=Sabethes cyaneus TaxID=53552 RepID=UPI00237D5596|nr:uncharacterized protein LOC128744707 [Sabethes cyaneus]